MKKKKTTGTEPARFRFLGGIVKRYIVAPFTKIKRIVSFNNRLFRAEKYFRGIKEIIKRMETEHDKYIKTSRRSREKKEAVRAEAIRDALAWVIKTDRYKDN